MTNAGLRDRPAGGTLVMVLLLAVLASALLIGCRPYREPDVVLWHAYRGAEADALRQVVQTFRAQHPQWAVEVIYVPSGAYANKLGSAIPRGRGPDVFVYAQERIGAWARGGVLEPLPDVPEIAAVQRAIPAQLNEAAAFDGVAYGLPIATKTPVLFYNREHLAALGEGPPRDTDAMVRLAQRFHDPDNGRFGLVYPVGDFYYHSGWVFGFGGRALDDGGQPVLDDPGHIHALAFAASLRNEAQILPRDAEYNVMRDRFGTGNALFAINGPWFLGELGGVPFGVVPLPIVTATGTPARPFVTVECALLARSRDRDRLPAATALVAWLAGPEASVVRARDGRQVVAHPAAWDDPSVANDEVLQAFAAAGEIGQVMPNIPQMTALWAPGNRALERVLRRGESPATALREAQRELDTLLQPTQSSQNLTPWLWGTGLGMLVLAGLAVRRGRAVRLVPQMVAARHAYLWILPALLAIIAIIIVPFVLGALVSLYRYEEGAFSFVGLANFVRVLSSDGASFFDPRSFWFTLVVTVAWTAINVALHVVIGLMLAMALREPWVAMRGMWRVLLILPWAVPNYITALIWKALFNFNSGAVNQLVRLLGGDPVDWFSSFGTAFTANVVTNTWLGFPFMLTICLGALQSVPKDLEDAAEIDGASRWQRFRFVVFPLLRPALVPAIVLGNVWTFNMFNIIYLVSGGGPDGSTDILITEAYRWAFQRNEQYGMAAAYGLLIFGVLWVYTRISSRWTAGEATS